MTGPLEMYVRVEGAGEFHFYTRSLPPADLASLFASEIRPLQVLIYRMPADLLNPNYWEPLTKEGENAVREKLVGIVTTTEGDRTMLWRADRVARSRMLRDGVEVQVELINGYIFRTTGEGLLSLLKAWSGRGRFEWTGLSLPAGSELPPEAPAVCHSDLAQMRRTLPEEAMIGAFSDADGARLILSRRDHLRRAVGTQILDFARSVSKAPYASLNDRTCDQVIRLADGLGFSASAGRDVVDKGRTLELNVRLGRTPWGVHLHPGQDPLVGDEKVFFYYDRTCGLWAVAS